MAQYRIDSVEGENEQAGHHVFKILQGPHIVILSSPTSTIPTQGNAVPGPFSPSTDNSSSRKRHLEIKIGVKAPGTMLVSLGGFFVDSIMIETDHGWQIGKGNVLGRESSLRRRTCWAGTKE